MLLLLPAPPNEPGAALFVGAEEAGAPKLKDGAVVPVAGVDVEAAVPNKLPEAGTGWASFDCVAVPNPVKPPNGAPVDGAAPAAGLPKLPPKAFVFGSSALAGAEDPNPPKDGLGASSFFSVGAGVEDDAD